MTNTKERVERRKHKRFRIEHGAFVGLGPRYDKVGRIIDISMGGLAFRCFGSRKANGSCLAVFFTETNFHLDEVQIKTISDFEIAGKLPSSSITARRCSVQFMGLTEKQRSQIEFFIKNYATGETEATGLSDESIFKERSQCFGNNP
ncbi:MAG: PilZ domain-containing protein [Deltaproteobacteria bacterium]|nr:PilZ domain-containing protein [Deltaproteobacteria bacterium]